MTAQRRVPRFPAIFRQAGISGTVDARYEIDLSGRVALGTLRIIATSHDLFAQSVRSAVQQTRLPAPLRNGQPVRVRVYENITFELDSVTKLLERSAATIAMDSSGVLHTTVLGYPRRDTSLAPLSEKDTWAIYYAVGEYFMRDTMRAPSAYCIQANGIRPPDQVFAQRRSTRRRVVPRGECPRTYGNMVRVLGEEGPPPGWVDPIAISLLVLQPWTRDLVILEARDSQGTGSSYYTCEAVREVTGWGAVTCVRTRSVVH
ncbi:MAG: energy transducer TonB [Gemmatimonadaceae bacterium]